MTMRQLGAAVAIWMLAAGLAGAAPAPDSKRLGHAKDLIADEQWTRAIAELQAAVDDPKEANRDEALFWLAHSQHQAGDDSSALQTIAKLERGTPTSKWVHPARSLRVEIAQRLRRDDLLWIMAAPPAPPAPPAAALPARPPSGSRLSPLPTPAAPPTPAAAPAPPAPATTPPPTPRAPRLAQPGIPVPPAPAAAPLPPPPGASEFWMPLVPAQPDMTLKVQALTGLLESHSDQVIPLLRQIALDRNSPDEARQAVFVLGQSRQPEARRTVIDIAHEGAEPVRIAAVRELGRFDGPAISSELMRVYSMEGTPRLKRQVVSSLGERADAVSLLRIAKSESEPTVRDFAIVTLGRTGARDQLHTLYLQAPQESRAAVLNALFSARDDDELIRIAGSERNPVLRQTARRQLSLLATPKAIKFLEDHP
jgi:HEAT repeat protein